MQWLRKAAKLGEPEAQFELAERYEHGDGARKNRRHALAWYRKAAEAGYSAAEAKLRELPPQTSPGESFKVPLRCYSLIRSITNRPTFNQIRTLFTMSLFQMLW